jgi:hypothetical protein
MGLFMPVCLFTFFLHIRQPTSQMDIAGALLQQNDWSHCQNTTMGNEVTVVEHHCNNEN